MEVNKDFEDFIKLLNKHKVEYCIVGAYAVSFHAEPRYTQDIDFFIARNGENNKKVYTVLKEYTGEQNIDITAMSAEKSIIRFGYVPNQIEIHNHLSGLSEKDILKHKIKGVYGKEITFYISIDDLIKNKSIVKERDCREEKKYQDEKDYNTLKKAKEYSLSRSRERGIEL